MGKNLAIRLAAIAVMIGGIALGIGSATVSHASVHRMGAFHRDITVRCLPDNSKAAYQAEILIHNAKRYATGRMHGFTVTALTPTGKVMHSAEGGYFKIPAFTQWGWFPTFPQRVASCTAEIRWAPLS